MRLAVAVLSLSVLLVLGCGSTDPSEDSPAVVAPQGPQRVVLVTIDTLRVDHLGSSGYPRDTSPFLDRLADEGTVFSHAFSSCSHATASLPRLR